MNIFRYGLLILCLPLVAVAPADTPNDPYENIPADAKRDELKAQLHELIKGHKALEYWELWDALPLTDPDPDNPDHVLLFYSGKSRSADKHGGDVGEWNREHLWALSRGGHGNKLISCDLHVVRPTDVRTNGARGNLLFDEGGKPWEDSGCNRDGDSWEPRDAVKGDVARALFYAATRYESPDLELIDKVLGQEDRRPLHGKLSTLLKWHKQDPPNEAEVMRNDRVEQIQGNRNPFVDRPEWVGLIWQTPKR